MGEHCEANFKRVLKRNIVNILFIADPNSIHDIRWINFFAEMKGFSCYIIPRAGHYSAFKASNTSLSPCTTVLAPISDPSTIRPLRNFWQIIQIKRVITRFRIDLLHVLYAEPNALWANGKWLLKIPMVLTTRGTDVLKTIPQFFEGKNFLQMIIASQYKRALQAFDEITCTSRSQANALVAWGVDRPVSIIRTGVDMLRIEPGNDDSKFVGMEKPFVFMPRNMKPIYNHEFTLEAIALLGDAIRKGYAFVFINSTGQDDPYFRTILRRSREIDADVRFVQHMQHQELLLLCKHASLVVMNPKSDGSPVTAMEAMALRRPLILPPLPYDVEIFGDAFFFKKWSPVSLKEAIEEILCMDSVEREQRVERNYRTIITKANIDIEMQRVKAIYNKLTFK